jgi:hypothetical protein
MGASPIPVVHPAPLTCLHRTPGQARVDFARLTTPCVLREADASAFDHVVDLPAHGDERRSLHAHDGALWVREPVTAAGFARMLATPPAHRGPPALTRDFHGFSNNAFVRSPLMAFWADGPARGLPAGVRKVRQVVSDGSDRARRDVLAFLDAHVRIVDGMVHRRVHGPLAVHAGTRLVPSFRVQLGEYRFSGASSMALTEHVATPRADRLDAFWDFEEGFYGRVRPVRLKGTRPGARVTLDDRGMGAVLGLGDPDSDILAFAWDAPMVAIRNLQAADFDDPEVRSAAERLHPWVALGLVGSTRPDEAETAVEAVCRLMEAVERSEVARGPHVGMLKLAAYGREVALPRLRERMVRIPPEDEAALVLARA